MVLVGPYFECHEVIKIPPSRLLQSRQHVVGGAKQAQVDVFRRSRSRNAELEDEATLESHPIAEHRDDSCKETREHQQLALARELGARLRRCA
jgi:hypothetical protein